MTFREAIEIAILLTVGIMWIVQSLPNFPSLVSLLKLVVLYTNFYNSRYLVIFFVTLNFFIWLVWSIPFKILIFTIIISIV
jgi:hypothetical protein